MISLKEAFERLGIEPTTDRKTIKKAYAAKVKQYHPEDCPEEWKQIKEAYETALLGCGAERTPVFFGEEEAGLLPEEKKDGSKQSEEEKELGGMFDRLDELAVEERKQKAAYLRELVNRALDSLIELRKEKNVSVQAWNDFFSQLEEEVFADTVFLDQWGRTLMELPMTRELSRLMETWIDCGEKITGKRLYYVRDKLKEAGPVKREDRPEVGLTCLFIGMVLLALLTLTERKVEEIREKEEREERLAAMEDMLYSDNQTDWDKYRRHAPLFYDDYIYDNEAEDEEFGIEPNQEENNIPDEETEAADSFVPREEVMQQHKKMIDFYLMEDRTEKEARLKEIIEGGIPIRDGVYLYKEGGVPGGETIFWNQSVNDVQWDPEEMSAEEMLLSMIDFYAIDLWAIKEGGVYVLYIDPLKLDLEMNCEVIKDNKEIPLYTSSAGTDIQEEYHYRIADYKAIVVDIPLERDKPCSITLLEQ